jgi:dTDP-4-dehydrorhamnose 3,5-epimerase
MFTETKFRGAFVIELEGRDDERGFFAHSFARHEPAHCQVRNRQGSENGSVRGTHFQFPPAAETNLVCGS